jgi:hypothetical protein
MVRLLLDPAEVFVPGQQTAQQPVGAAGAAMSEQYLQQQQQQQLLGSGYDLGSDLPEEQQQLMGSAYGLPGCDLPEEQQQLMGLRYGLPEFGLAGYGLASYGLAGYGLPEDQQIKDYFDEQQQVEAAGRGLQGSGGTRQEAEGGGRQEGWGAESPLRPVEGEGGAAASDLASLGGPCFKCTYYGCPGCSGGGWS